MSSTEQIQLLLKTAQDNKQSGNLKQALDDVKEALRLDPSHQPCQELLCQLLELPILTFEEFIKVMSLTDSPSIVKKRQVLQRLQSCPANVIDKSTFSEFINCILIEKDPELKDQLFYSLYKLVLDSKECLFEWFDQIHKWNLLLEYPMTFTILYECILKTQDPSIHGSIVKLLKKSSSESNTCQFDALNALVRSLSHSEVILNQVHPSLFLSLLNDSNTQLPSLAVIGLQHIVQSSSLEIMRETIGLVLQEWIHSMNINQKMLGLKGLEIVSQLQNTLGNEIFQKESTISCISELIQSDKQDRILSVLLLVSTACMDVKNRNMISSLLPILKTHSHSLNKSIQSVATVILAKLSLNESENHENQDQMSLLQTCLNSINDMTLESCKYGIEAIAILSINPKIKQKLIQNVDFLQKLSKIIVTFSNEKTILYGIAIIYVNLSSFKRKLSPEQEQLKKLKEFASGNKNQTDDPLEMDEMVIQRNSILLKTQIVPNLILLAKNHPSDSMLESLSLIFLNCAHDKSFRGLMIQQGAIKCLLGMYKRHPDKNAAQGLAKLLITSDPNTVFKGDSVLECVDPLINLLKGMSNDLNYLHRTGDDGLCQFEGLLALTNLASMPDETIRSHMIRLEGIPIVESLVFSDNILIRRASTELMCNMMYHKHVFERYSQPGSSQRLKLFIALSDSEDFATQRAASGVLAILASSKEGCISMLKEDRFLSVLKILLHQENVEILHR